MMNKMRMPQMAADLMAILLAAILVSACGDQPVAAPEPALQVTVESGVLELTPTAPETDDVVVTVSGELPEEPPAPPVDPDILDVGAEVQARGMLRLYAVADPEALTLAEYAAGDRFTVLGPPGDISVYPVELSGVRWYRVRAEDGLVGWVMADGIEVVPAE